MTNLGKCILCGNPVVSDSFHVKSKVGLIHGECVMEWKRKNK